MIEYNTNMNKTLAAAVSSADFSGVPEVESSSTSSCIASQDDIDSDGGSVTDQYADVRQRMEELSARDKARFARNTSEVQVQHEEMSTPTFPALTTYLGYAVLIVCGHVRDIFARIFGRGRYLREDSGYPSDNRKYFAPLLKGWENFFTRRVYHRIQDCFNRPLASNPGVRVHVLERVSSDGNKTMNLLGSLNDLQTDEQKVEYTTGPHYIQVSDNRVARSCLNLGSYNYLGFADDWDVTCRKDVMASLKDLAVSTGSSRTTYGTTKLHREVEELVAEFVGKEDSLALNMGFNTNATVIPALMTSGDLIISDQLNHTSIVNGARGSGAAIRVFRHNDTENLEQILREAIIMGQPRTRRPWKKIMVVVEGIYSMEGEYADLRNIVRVCKKFGAYVYLDEAHSIGAMGPTGRGLSEYTGVDPKDIDIMMGTFTKSFGGMGGYVAASKEIIASLRQKCAGSTTHNSLSPVVCQQIISSFKVIMGRDGTDIGKKKLQTLRDNSNYTRMRLEEMGLVVLGHYDSPIIPVMLYNPPKIAAFSRECLKRGLAVVVVGFPAVPVLLARVRFCISAGHTRDELDRALAEISDVATSLQIRHGLSAFG